VLVTATCSPDFLQQQQTRVLACRASDSNLSTLLTYALLGPEWSVALLGSPRTSCTATAAAAGAQG
jgi:hypothetical protein